VEPGCYSRIYDRAHLGKHPDQLVTSMRLLLTLDGGFVLRVTLRGSDAVLSTDGTCAQRPYGLQLTPDLRNPVDCLGRVEADERLGQGPIAYGEQIVH
jgi:hypothetical protein